MMHRPARYDRSRTPFSRALALLVALALAATMLLAAGCGGDTAGTDASDAATSAGESAASTQEPAAATFPVTVTDDLGREVEIATEPQRIVSLAPANTEIVAALGLIDRLVGVTTYCNYPAEVADIAKVGDFVSPNLEAIAAAEPDLILATTGVQADVIEQLEALGAAVIAIDPQTIEAVYASIGTVGDATGAGEEAAALVAKMQADLAEIASAYEDEEPVTCFLEIAQEPLFTAGSGTLQDDLIRAAGGTNVVTEAGYVGYSLEQLLADDPTVYMATKGSMSDPTQLESRAGYDALSAVKTGAVYVLDDDLVSRPGPRVVEGVRQIAEALHSDPL